MAGRPIPTVEELLTRLRELGSPERIAGQQRYGIHGREQWGVSMPDIRATAKGVKDHRLALDLWQTGVHEAQLLASLIDRPQWVTREQMDVWVVDFDSWDLVDQTCMNLFDPTPFCWEAASSWMEREDEFVRRAGFVLIASRSVHDKSAQIPRSQPISRRRCVIAMTTASMSRKPLTGCCAKLANAARRCELQRWAFARKSRQAAHPAHAGLHQTPSAN